MATQQTLFSFADTPALADVPLPPGGHSGRGSAPRRHDKPSRRNDHPDPSDLSGQEPSSGPVGIQNLAESEDHRDTTLRRLRSLVGCVVPAPDVPADGGPAPDVPADGGPADGGPAVFSTGCDEIDRWLPEGGLRIDAVTEWVAAHDSSGAITMAMIAVAMRMKKSPDAALPLVVVDPAGTFYPPAAAALGIDVRRVIWCRPRSAGDAVWAIDQSLRSGAVGAVMGVIHHRLDDRDARRFQLAAEAGRTPAMLVHPWRARGNPSFAKNRFFIRPLPSAADSSGTGNQRQIQWTLDRCKGGRVGRQAVVAIDDRMSMRLLSLESNQTSPAMMRENDEKAAVHLAARLAHPTAAGRRVGRPNAGGRHAG